MAIIIPAQTVKGGDSIAREAIRRLREMRQANCVHERWYRDGEGAHCPDCGKRDWDWRLEAEARERQTKRHTPGPWRVDDQTKGWNGEPGDWRWGWRVAAFDNCHLAQVGSVDPRYKDQAGANARLIAKSPELLEACKRTREAIARHVFECGQPGTWATALDDYLAELIAEAEGTTGLNPAA